MRDLTSYAKNISNWTDKLMINTLQEYLDRI